MQLTNSHNKKYNQDLHYVLKKFLSRGKLEKWLGTHQDLVSKYPSLQEIKETIDHIREDSGWIGRTCQIASNRFPSVIKENSKSSGLHALPVNEIKIADAEIAMNEIDDISFEELREVFSSIIDFSLRKFCFDHYRLSCVDDRRCKH